MVQNIVIFIIYSELSVSLDRFQKQSLSTYVFASVKCPHFFLYRAKALESLFRIIL
jgi:hypothetical protein